MGLAGSVVRVRFTGPDAVAARTMCRESGAAAVLGPRDPSHEDVLVVDEWTAGTDPFVTAARARGVRVTVLAELLLERVRCPVIAVTGTAGKTITCHMVAHLLRVAGRRPVMSTTARSGNAWPDHSLVGVECGPDPSRIDGRVCPLRSVEAQGTSGCHRPSNRGAPNRYPWCARQPGGYPSSRSCRHYWERVPDNAGVRRLRSARPVAPPYTTRGPQWCCPRGLARSMHGRCCSCIDSGRYRMTYTSARARARALRSRLRHHNERRPHSALGGRPPISPVRNVCRQDIQAGASRVRPGWRSRSNCPPCSRYWPTHARGGE